MVAIKAAYSLITKPAHAELRLGVSTTKKKGINKMAILGGIIITAIAIGAIASAKIPASGKLVLSGMVLYVVLAV